MPIGKWLKVFYYNFFLLFLVRISDSNFLIEIIEGKLLYIMQWILSWDFNQHICYLYFETIYECIIPEAFYWVTTFLCISEVRRVDCLQILTSYTILFAKRALHVNWNQEINISTQPQLLTESLSIHF